MYALRTLVVALAWATATATAAATVKSSVKQQQRTLYAAVADGTVQTLVFNGTALSLESSLVACGASPSWLTFTEQLLYCSGEATPGTLSTFAYTGTGALVQRANVSTTGGDVSSVIYGEADKQFIALAHYGHNSISTYALPLENSSVLLQNITLPFPGPGVSPRQNTGYPHQVILDPSRRFVFSPDLGADRVRVFAVDDQSGMLSQVAEITLERGTGPRHVAFYQPEHQKSAGKGNSTTPTFVYLASELANNLTGFRMDVDNKSVPTFTQIVPFLYTTNVTDHNASTVAEVRVKGNTLTVSNRGDATFGPGMDSLTVFTIASNGTLSDRRIYPSGGSFPRSFEISADGTMVAVGNQMSPRTTILERDVNTGAIGKVLASLTMSGQVIDVTWAQ